MSQSKARRKSARRTRKTQRRQFWFLIEHPLLFGGSLALLLAAIGFELAGALKLAGIFYLAAWLILCVVVYRAALLKEKPKRTILALVIVGATFGGIWWSLSATVSKTDEKLDEVTRLLKQLGEEDGRRRLLAKYPLGYVIFELDYKRGILPYDQQLLDQYDIDWSVVRLTKNTGGGVNLCCGETKSWWQVLGPSAQSISCRNTPVGQGVVGRAFRFNHLPFSLQVF